MRRDWFDSYNGAMNGLLRAARTHRTIRLQLAAALVAIGVAIVVRLSVAEFVMLVLAMGLVLVAELTHGALVIAVEMAPEHERPRARAARDMASGAVLIAAVVALSCGWLVIAPRLRTPASSAIAAAERGPEFLTGLALFGTIVTVVLGKVALGRGQPLRGGMPSGHAAAAFSLATAGAFISRDALVALTGVALALLVARSRLLSRVHTPGEVAAGSLLGVLVTLLVFQVLR